MTNATGGIVSTQETYTFIVTSDISLTANFEKEIIKQYYTINVSANTGGTVNISGGTYEEGDVVTIIATSNDGYRFVNWTNSLGSIISTQSYYTFTAMSSINLIANFEQIKPNSCSVDIWATTGGTISHNGGVYEKGAEITIQALPNSGYHFVNWTDATGMILSEQDSYAFIVSSNMVLRANFERDVYSVHITESPDISLWADKYSVYWNESVIIHAQLIGESSDTDKIKVLYKCGENGLWETVYGSNDFYIYNVYSDIYVRAERYTYVANEVIADKGIQIYTQNGCLYVQTFKLQQVHIIALNGTSVRSRKQSGLQCYDGLEPGVYLVRVDKRTFKVLVTR